MTHATTIKSPPMRPLDWTSPESKLWVATRDGEFAGFIEFCEGHYAIADRTGLILKPRATLSAAQSALENVDAPPAPSIPSRALASIAVGFGASALCCLAVAIGVIHL